MHCSARSRASPPRSTARCGTRRKLVGIRGMQFKETLRKRRIVVPAKAGTTFEKTKIGPPPSRGRPLQSFSSACLLALLLAAGCAGTPEEESIVWSDRLARSLELRSEEHTSELQSQ